jgi:hypothetical protein
MDIAGNEQADEEAKGALDDDTKKRRIQKRNKTK